ncbi:MAG TPA: hypothetical protein VM345_07705 [Acidimicrobiales bacterium]|jgi:hypothetical protein|nr:hypothetical protein [Acidimicrobiales bacterium]
MSDTPVGADWWQASDGKWYPPEQHPDYRPPEQPASQYSPYVPPYGSSDPPPYGSTSTPSYGSTAYGSTYGGYGQPAYAAAPQTSSKATIALVLSIVSFVVCPVISAIVSLVFASQAKKEIRASGGRYTGDGLVTASRIISIANIVLTALAVAGFALLIAAIPDDAFDEVGGSITESSEDFAAQSDLRDALFAQQTYYIDNDRYTDNLFELDQIDPSIQFEQGNAPGSVGVVVVQVGGQQVVLGTRSATGECFYITESQMSDTRYARDPGCGPFSSQVFLNDW